LSASAGVNGGGVSLPLPLQVFNVFARAAARVGESELCQLRQSAFISAVALALNHHLAIPVQFKALQGVHDVLRSTCNTTRIINILNAQQPPAMVCFCIQPSADGGCQRTQVQRPCGAGRKPTDIA